VVEDPGKQIYPFGTGAVKETVINNEDILALFVRQWFHEAIDNTGGKQRCKALPVRPGIIHGAVDSVL